MTENEKIIFVENAIQKLFPNIPTTKLTKETNLLDLGVDSLGIVELQMYYEEETGETTLDPEGAVVTVGDLIKLIP